MPLCNREKDHGSQHDTLTEGDKVFLEINIK